MRAWLAQIPKSWSIDTSIDLETDPLIDHEAQDKAGKSVRVARNKRNFGEESNAAENENVHIDPLQTGES